MTGLHITNVAIVVGVVIAVISLISTIIGWIYRKGDRDRGLKDALAALKVAVEDNTKATNKVAEEFHSFQATTYERFEKNEIKLENHDVRISAVEVRLANK